MDFDRRPIRPEVLAALTQVPEIAQQVRDVAKAIAADARALAPRETGTLARNVRHERAYDATTRTVSYIVGWTSKAWYGWLVETGTEDVPPRPHLVPAAIKHGAVASRER